MRVPLNPRDDRGAVAVMTALLLVVLVGIAAFAVDFGLAYTNKRQLSTGADAAALAAAKSYADQPMQSCGSLISNTPVSQTRDLADTYAEQNRPGKTRTAWDPECDGTGAQLTVRYGNSKTISTVFGGIFGVSDIGAEREATAAVRVFTQGPGLRPYAMCLGDVLPYLGEISDPQTLAPTFHVSFYPNPACTVHNDGNWYSVDCPGSGSNGNGTTETQGSFAYNTKYGCDDYIKVITPNDVPTLRSTCDVASPDEHECLGANPGNLTNNNLADAWTYLRDKEIALPVFKKDSIIDSNGGNNWVFPVAGVVGIKVCGYHWHNAQNEWISSDPECLGAAQPTGSQIPSTNPPTTDWLIWRLVTLQQTGLYGAPTCRFGDTCDLGVRSVALVK